MKAGMHHRDTEDTEAPLAGLTSRIIGAAVEVHRELGPGLLESAYGLCLEWELRARGMAVAREMDETTETQSAQRFPMTTPALPATTPPCPLCLCGSIS